MPNESIRAGVDQLMIGGDRDVDGEEAPEMNDGVEAQDEAGDKHHHAEDHEEVTMGQSCVAEIPGHKDAETDAERDDDPE
jgi:hypothetical protein